MLAKFYYIKLYLPRKVKLKVGIAPFFCEYKLISRICKIACGFSRLPSEVGGKDFIQSFLKPEKGFYIMLMEFTSSVGPVRR